MKQFDFEAIFNYYSDDPYIFTPSVLEDFKNEDIELPDNYNIYLVIIYDNTLLKLFRLITNYSRI